MVAQRQRPSKALVSSRKRSKMIQFVSSLTRQKRKSSSVQSKQVATQTSRHKLPPIVSIKTSLKRVLTSYKTHRIKT